MFGILKWIFIFIAIVVLAYLFFPEQVLGFVYFLSELVFRNEEFLIEKFQAISNAFNKVYEVFMGVIAFIKNFLP